MMAGLVIVLVLTSITFAVTRGAMESGYTARETAAARTLASAYAAATADNDGVFLPGFDDSATGYTASGVEVSAAAAHRYPYRLAPYFGYGLDGVILVNRNKGQIRHSSMPQDYATSLFPALGMNLSYVGGIYEGGALEMSKECATRMGQVSKPSSMLLFASAGYGAGEKKIDGYNRLEPPNKRVTIWATADDADSARDKPPGNYGNIDFRHNGLAVCVFLDGSIRMMAPKQLRDMRLWNRNAQDLDDPDYRVPVETPPPGSGSGRR
jgi:hypothetical protein